MLQPRYPAAVPIERGFLRLAHGDVHYRAAGEGPVVLALHESPRSSLSLLPVIEALSPRFRVVAIDTPGYGLSAPLPGEAPGMDDFLDVIAGVLDALAVGRAALYGAHTGAALALAFALREPARASALVLDGLSAFTAPEVEAFRTRYLAPYEPAWDGAHVMRLWSRAKDLFTWFPWYEQTPARRLSCEPQTVEALQRSALGFLQAGAHYAKAYVLAASFQPNQVIGALEMPATVIARPADLIADHLDRLTPGQGWEIVWLDEAAETWRTAIRRGLDKGGTPDGAGLSPAVAAQGSMFLPVGAGWMHAVAAGPVDGALRVLLAGLPGDALALAAQEAGADPDERLVVLSLPGCGWSDPLASPEQGLSGVLDALDAALKRLGGTPQRLGGEGASAAIAELWARRCGWSLHVERLATPAWLDDPDSLPTAPLLTRSPPRWDGAHLTAAWFQLRDLALYDVPPGAGVPRRRRGDAPVDAARLDRLFRVYVEGPECADLLQQVVDHLRDTPRGAQDRG